MTKVIRRIPVISKELLALKSILLVEFVLLNREFSVHHIVDHCLSFCHFLLATVLSVLQFMASDYSGIFIKYCISKKMSAPKH
jgi:hypothetical protein